VVVIVLSSQQGNELQFEMPRCENNKFEFCTTSIGNARCVHHNTGSQVGLSSAQVCTGIVDTGDRRSGGIYTLSVAFLEGLLAL